VTNSHSPQKSTAGRRASRLAILFGLLGVVGFASQPALAQYRGAPGTGSGKAVSAFPEQPGGIFGKPQKLDKTLPLYLQGDELVYDNSGSRVIARGNVEIFYNKNVLTADQVIYDRSANTLTASGNVELKEANGNIIRADNYTLTDDFRDGFVQSLSVVTRDDSRITAERGERREGNVTEFSDATFTACKSEGNVPPLWCIGAKRIIHDQTAQTISYQDAELKLYGMTVGYLPYFEHPDPSVKRKSGFLAPGYGNSGDLGVFTEIPYYFALSPNFDFLFNPRYMSEQGVMWQGEWRQKLANGEYNVKFAAIDQDWTDLPSRTTRAEDLDGWRGSVETHGRFSLSSWWSYGWNAIIESDDTFRRFYKLDSVLLTDRVNDVWLKGQSERSYFSAKMYQFGGLMVTDNDEAESYVHPIIDHNYVFKDPVLGGELSWKSNALSFSRSDTFTGDGLLSQDMNRFVTEVKWRRRFTDALGITYTPFGELRGDAYQIKYDDLTGGPGAVNLDDQFLRGLATGGATVSYPWVANVGSTSHVIEPIGQIVAHSSHVDQDFVPNEDAKSLIFDDTNLFDTTKFSGYDRLETGVRANVGVQYTFQGPVGYARILAGQSFHLSGNNAYDPADVATSGFNTQSGLETKDSDYVLGAYIAPTDMFRLISQSRFDEDDFSLRRQDMTAVFSYGPLLAGATYSYGDAYLEETSRYETQEDILGYASLRLTDRWSIGGSLRYSIDEDRMLTDSIRIAYLDECFMLSATYSETFIRDPDRDIEPDQVVMLRFEFKHLGGFNYETNVVDFAGGEDASAVHNP
jgi:LPS-assembly protein